MEIKIAVLADAANVSREGKLNVTGIFNRINAGEFPLTWPLLVLVIRLEAHASESGRHSLKVRVADEDGGEVTAMDGEMHVPRAKDRSRAVTAQFILGIQNARFQKPGTYSFDILIDGRFETTVPLHVVKGKRS